MLLFIKLPLVQEHDVGKKLDLEKKGEKVLSINISDTGYQYPHSELGAVGFKGSGLTITKTIFLKLSNVYRKSKNCDLLIQEAFCEKEMNQVAINAKHSSTIDVNKILGEVDCKESISNRHVSRGIFLHMILILGNSPGG